MGGRRARAGVGRAWAYGKGLVGSRAEITIAHAVSADIAIASVDAVITDMVMTYVDAVVTDMVACSHDGWSSLMRSVLRRGAAWSGLARFRDLQRVAAYHAMPKPGVASALLCGIMANATQPGSRRAAREPCRIAACPRRCAALEE